MQGSRGPGEPAKNPNKVAGTIVQFIQPVNDFLYRKLLMGLNLVITAPFVARGIIGRRLEAELGWNNGSKASKTKGVDNQARIAPSYKIGNPILTLANENRGRPRLERLDIVRVYIGNAPTHNGRNGGASKTITIKRSVAALGL